MSELREQYERDHPGKIASGPQYVAWLERRAACAEQLAAGVLKDLKKLDEDTVVIKKALPDSKSRDVLHGQAVGLEMAIIMIESRLTAHEAAHKGKP